MLSLVASTPPRSTAYFYFPIVQPTELPVHPQQHTLLRAAASEVACCFVKLIHDLILAAIFSSYRAECGRLRVY
jgi:hypothetical protein